MTGDNMKKIQSITLDLLREIGEDPDREGLQKTPSRVARAWEHFIKATNRRLRKLWVTPSSKSCATKL